MTAVLAAAEERPLTSAQRRRAAPGLSALDRVWYAGLAVMAAQVVAMLVFTTLQYRRYNLTADFAGNAQAWAAIAHGHFDPFVSVFGMSLWRNDMPLVLWPLAVFYWLFPYGVTLLWLQVLAVVAGELVVLAWVRQFLAASKRTTPVRASVLVVVMLLLMVTPWSWFTIGFDFHFEPFTAFFGLMTAWDLSRGRHRRLWAWVPLTLASCATPGALLVTAIGLTAAFGGRRERSAGLVTAATGITWFTVAAALGALHFGGEGVSTMYGYLAGRGVAHAGMSQVVAGLLLHPWRGLHMIARHGAYLAGYVVSGGIVGLFSRWALIPAAFVLLPSALNANVVFIHFAAAFQSWPAVLFITVGTAMALERMPSTSSRPLHSVAAFGGLSLVMAVGLATYFVPDVPKFIERVSPAAAGQLNLVRVKSPTSAEVIASQGVMGRFGPGRTAYPFWALGRAETYPITAGRPVLFVFAPVQGTSEGEPAETYAAMSYVRSALHARPVTEGAGIWSFLWVPRHTTPSVRLP